MTLNWLLGGGGAVAVGVCLDIGHRKGSELGYHTHPHDTNVPMWMQTLESSLQILGLAFLPYMSWFSSPLCEADLPASGEAPVSVTHSSLGNTGITDMPCLVQLYQCSRDSNSGPHACSTSTSLTETSSSALKNTFMFPKWKKIKKMKYVLLRRIVCVTVAFQRMPGFAATIFAYC